MNARIPAAHAGGGHVERAGLRHGGRAAQEPAVPVVQAEDAVRAARGRRCHRFGERGQVGDVPQRLRPDDDARGPGRHGAARVVRRRHPRVEPDRQAEPGDRADDRAVVAGPGDGVEVRHVAGLRAEALPEGARQLDRIGRGGQHAPHRRVGVALAAHRVHGDAALEIEHRDHAHGRAHREGG